MYYRWFGVVLSLSLLPNFTWAERDVLKVQLLDNVRANFFAYQAYDIPDSAISQIKSSNGRAIDIQFLVATLIKQACADEENEDVHTCESDKFPLDWLTLSTTTLCLTPESIKAHDKIKNNLCLIFPHAMPFPTDSAAESNIVNLNLNTGKAWHENNTTYFEVVDVKTH